MAADYQDLINQISQGNTFTGDRLAILNAHYGELQAGLEAILTAITSLNQGDRCKDSLEFGSLSSGRLKIYFDARDPTEAEMLISNSLKTRAYANREITTHEDIL